MNASQRVKRLRNMKFIKQKFKRLEDYDSASTFSDFTFERCEFEWCAVSIARTPEFRSTIRGGVLRLCVVRGNCDVWSPIIEDSVIDGLRTPGTLFLRGAVFKHVVIKGKIGGMVFAGPYPRDGRPDEAFLKANREYYASVDWALDLTQCESQLELSLSSVPGHLIRRDPTTQVLVTRERALACDWRKIDLEGTAYDIAIEQLLSEGRDSEVLVAPSGHRSFSMHLKAQQRLRDAGVAEPN
jgi:hypothetical protein